jgi:glycosyltransferase involved in cell wall biosynthesis
MKIVAVYNRYLNRGGEDEVFESEAELLRRHGCTVKLVTEQVTAPRDLGGKIALALNAVWSRKWYANFQALLKSARPDVVHVHNLVPDISPSVLHACRKAGVAVVHTLHNYRLLCPASIFFRDGHVCEECLQHSLWRGINYGCYQNSRAGTGALAAMLALHRQLATWRRTVDCYVVLSEFARQKFIEGGLPAAKIVVKPNFVDPDPGNGAGGGEYALFVGRLSPQKGVPTLLAGWERLSGCIPLAVIGDGPLAHAVNTAGLCSPSIRYLGRLTREETLQAMKKARFLVFPSVWYEGFPLTIAEAFACGIPVICSRLGAMREIVEDGRTGLHFQAGNAENLAERVEWAWTHPAEMQVMGRTARREYEAKYTAERNYEMLTKIYHRAMLAHQTHAAGQN